MLEIRYAQAGDAKDLGAIQSSSWRAAYRGIVPDEVLEAYTPQIREQAFATFLSTGESLTAVALCGGNAAGFASFGRCRDEDLEGYGEVWGIYLSPEYWRHGIGSALLNWAVDELKAKGFTSASLWVLEQNSNARAFYEKHGFKADGARKELEIGKKLAAVRYARQI